MTVLGTENVIAGNETGPANVTVTAFLTVSATVKFARSANEVAAARGVAAGGRVATVTMEVGSGATGLGESGARRLLRTGEGVGIGIAAGSAAGRVGIVGVAEVVAETGEGANGHAAAVGGRVVGGVFGRGVAAAVGHRRRRETGRDGGRNRAAGLGIPRSGAIFLDRTRSFLLVHGTRSTPRPFCRVR